MAEDGQHPPKRPRTSPYDDGHGTTGSSSHATGITFTLRPERDGEFWLEDGNIVLIAQDIGFKVYKGLLTAQSPVFGDMFSAKSLRSDERFEGVPVARLFDSPIELRHLFRVLLPKTQRDVLKDTYDLKTEFHVMSALIRLAHKYQIDDVEKRALSALSAIYTSYRWRWIHVETQSSEEDRVFAIAAVNLARLTNTPSVLPSALYHCALLGSRVLSGFTREDGTVEYLSQDDLGRCMDGIAKLTAATAASKLSLALSAERSCADSCAQVGLCAVALRSVSTSLKEDVLHFHAPPDALGGENEHWTGVGVCDRCVAKLEHEQGIMLDNIWKRLPEIFGIQGLEGAWPGGVHLSQ